MGSVEETRQQITKELRWAGISHWQQSVIALRGSQPACFGASMGERFCWICFTCSPDGFKDRCDTRVAAKGSRMAIGSANDKTQHPKAHLGSDACVSCYAVLCRYQSSLDLSSTTYGECFRAHMTAEPAC
jgi:hypothetical protein